MVRVTSPIESERRGGSVFELHGPNANLKTNAPIEEALRGVATSPIDQALLLRALLGEQGQGLSGDLLREVSSRTPGGLMGEDPANVPFSVPFSGDPRQRSVAESQAGQPFELPEISLSAGQGPFSGGGSFGDFRLGFDPDTMSITLESLNPATEMAPPPPGAVAHEPFGGDFSQDDVRAAFGGGGGQEREFTIPLPQSGEEAFPAIDFPTLDRGTVDDLLEQLKSAVPEPYDKQDITMEAFLAGVGQGAMGADTVGEFLLGAGTGGMTTLAQHRQQQEELARQTDKERRAGLADVASSAFDAERALVESQQRAAQVEQDRQARIAQRDLARTQAIADRTDVRLSGDQIVITEPIVDEQGNVTDRVRTEIITADEQQQIMDSMSMTGDFSDLPEDLRNKLASVQSYPAKQNTMQAYNIAVEQTLTYPQIARGLAQVAAVAGQDVEDPGRLAETFRNDIEQRALAEIVRKQGLDVDVGEDGRLTEANVIAAAQASGSEDLVDRTMDEIERSYWTTTIDVMSKNPLYNASVYMASGDPVLQRLAVNWAEKQAGQ